MQTTIPDDLPRRMRYYQSMIDVDSLIAGSNYITLKESYIIFLCTKDPFRLGLPVYTFNSVCKESKDFALGEARGEKRGLLAGEQKKAIETAKKMFEENIPAETIAECTGLPLEKVNKLNQNNS